uniref:Uncharacterized protein n=1 Tax=Anguilla anguilla TaxID=7936 RepID=A0A0E9XIR7_ANGAN
MTLLKRRRPGSCSSKQWKKSRMELYMKLSSTIAWQCNLCRILSLK